LDEGGRRGARIGDREEKQGGVGEAKVEGEHAGALKRLRR
jgi:hypothetical protein